MKLFVLWIVTLVGLSQGQFQVRTLVDRSHIVELATYDLVYIVYVYICIYLLLVQTLSLQQAIVYNSLYKKRSGYCAPK